MPGGTRHCGRLSATSTPSPLHRHQDLPCGDICPADATWTPLTNCPDIASSDKYRMPCLSLGQARHTKWMSWSRSLDAELGEDAINVSLHRPHRDDQPIGDLTVG